MVTISTNITDSAVLAKKDIEQDHQDQRAPDDLFQAPQHLRPPCYGF